VHLEALEPVDVEFQLRSKLYRCSVKQVRETLNGSIFLIQQLREPDTEVVKACGISLESFDELYMNKLRSGDQQLQIQPSQQAALFFDAVWSFVLALDAVVGTIALGSYGHGQPKVTDAIAEKIVSSDYEGLSGRIHFDRITGHATQNAQFSVVNTDSITLLSYYNRKSDDVLTYDSSLEYENIFIKDTFDEEVLTVPRPLTYFILLLLLVAFLLTLTLNVATCAYRKVNSVKASSIKLSQVAFLGCYALALSLLLTVLVYGFTDKISTGAVCKLQHALDISVSVGLTLLLGAICVRIWRLHRIFNHYRDPGKHLSDQYLILVIVILEIINLALTVPGALLTKSEIAQDKVEQKRSIISVIHICKRPSIAFFILSISNFSVSAVLLSIIFIFAILTRKIPLKNFKTKSIMNLSYTLAVVVPLTMGTYLIFVSLEGYTNMVLRCCALCSFLLCLILLPCAMLFFPPFIPMLKSKLLAVSYIFS
jgi:hypothetical protein